MSTQRRRFLVDTDIATDDALALVVALRGAGVEVPAITVVAGNAPMGPCTRTASHLCSRLSTRADR